VKQIISKTGIINGRGSKFRWVNGLTGEERRAVREGGTVLVKDDNDHHTTTSYKLVTFYEGKYSHRNFYGEVQL
tara:strand:+ start:952 stop:1173 length:222 start_codon:yes stop_codon:yes gene_type:complete